MANEAVIIEINNNRPITFTVADGVGIEKGTICKLSDPRTAAATSGDGDVIAGIAAAEKVASDGATTLGMYVPGQGNIFDLTCAADGVTLGAYVKVSGANLIDTASEAEIAAGKFIGKALETGTSGEVIAVLV